MSVEHELPISQNPLVLPVLAILSQSELVHDDIFMRQPLVEGFCISEDPELGVIIREVRTLRIETGCDDERSIEMPI